MTMTLTVSPLPPELAATADRTFVDGSGGTPLRCCLRDSRVGERLALVSVVPPGPVGAYAEHGPVFLHADACPGPAVDGYPEDFRVRDQVLRAYGRNGTIVGGRVVRARSDHMAAAAELLTDPGVAFVQTRNVVHGCYMLTLTRGGNPVTGRRAAAGGRRPTR